MSDGRVPIAGTILAALLAIAALMWAQPYSVLSPYRSYTEPADAAFLRPPLPMTRWNSKDTRYPRNLSGGLWQLRMETRVRWRSGSGRFVPTPAVGTATPRRSCSRPEHSSLLSATCYPGLRW